MTYRHNLPKNEPSEGVWVNIKGDTTFLKAGTGMSLFYFPSFVVAHLVAQNNNHYNANGYSYPYQLALALNTLLFGILGLFICRRILLLHFNDLSVALAIVLLYGGSNFYYYITMEPAMSHPYGFFLVSWLLLLTFQFFKTKKISTFLLLGFVIGWMVTVRPTNAIIAMYPIIYAFMPQNRNELLNWLNRHRIAVIGAMLCMILPMLPQFIYWKSVMGEWIFYSYDQEKFFFNKPHIINGLFGFRKGFFIYTPTMFASVIGFVWLKRKKDWLLPMTIVLPIFIFVVFSWWCWWYGGHSSRVLIEVYPLLLFGLAAFSEKFFHLKWLPKLVVSVLIIFTIQLNFRLTNLYNRGVIHWDSMTYGNYKALFWNDKIPENYWDLYKKPDYEKAMREGEDLW